MFTLETWVAKAGLEEEFAAAWEEHTRSTVDESPGIVGGVRLFRDADEPGRFYCPILWERVEDIAAWRAGGAYRDRADRLVALSGGEPIRVLTVAAEIAPRGGEAQP